MDQARIKQLIDLMASTDLQSLTLSEGGTTLTLGKGAAAAVPAMLPVPVPAEPALPALPAVAEPAAAPATPLQGPIEVPSPLYGIAHLTPSPEEPAFVTIGDLVSEGQTVCIVEAMKMFHTVKAPRAGRVERILIEAGQEVESGQPLLTLARP